MSIHETKWEAWKNVGLTFELSTEVIRHFLMEKNEGSQDTVLCEDHGNITVNLGLVYTPPHIRVLPQFLTRVALAITGIQATVTLGHTEVAVLVLCVSWGQNCTEPFLTPTPPVCRLLPLGTLLSPRIDHGRPSAHPAQKGHAVSELWPTEVEARGSTLPLWSHRVGSWDFVTSERRFSTCG